MCGGFKQVNVIPPFESWVSKGSTDINNNKKANQTHFHPLKTTTPITGMNDKHKYGQYSRVNECSKTIY